MFTDQTGQRFYLYLFVFRIQNESVVASEVPPVMTNTHCPLVSSDNFI